MIALILAQATTDPTSLSGGAGWVGAGLLGSVLFWLLVVHLPAKDKFLKDLIDAKDKQINSILERKWDMLRSMSTDYKQSLKEVADHCQQEMNVMSQRWCEDIEKLSAAVEKLSGAINHRSP